MNTRICFVACVAAIALPATPTAANDVTILSLPGNPSTGYAWHINDAASTGLDLVAIESRGYGPPASDLIGAPAPTLFAVTCIGTGEVRLVFDYVSPSGTTVGETRAVEFTCD